MPTLLQKIKIKFFGNVGTSMSSAAPVIEHKPPKQPVRFSAEIDGPVTETNGEVRSPRPAGDGWAWDRGAWTRPIRTVKRCGHYHGRVCKCEDPAADDAPTPRRRIVSINDPFKDRRY